MCLKLSIFRWCLNRTTPRGFEANGFFWGQIFVGIFLARLIGVLRINLLPLCGPYAAVLWWLSFSVAPNTGVLDSIILRHG